MNTNERLKKANELLKEINYPFSDVKSRIKESNIDINKFYVSDSVILELNKIGYFWSSECQAFTFRSN